VRCSRIFAAVAALALVGAAPSGASPAPSAAPLATLMVVCGHTPLYVFLPGANRPSRTPEPDATIGERFALVSGPRTTLEGFSYYETDVVAIEPGHRGHYWLSQTCAFPQT
jgi:hypothetical protein